MELYIRIKDGQPFEHPILGDNFRAAFPKINTDNLPPEFARFKRVEAPILGAYQKNQRVQYERNEDGVVCDVWYCDQMSEEEKIEKQNQVKNQWTENGGFASWTFDDETCSFVAPIPRPDDGNVYFWNEESLSWVQPQEGEPNGS